MQTGTRTHTTSPARSVADVTSPPRAGDELRARYGTPDRLTSAEVHQLLRRQGLRDRLHPYDCCAFRYPSLEAAQAFADLNRASHGHDVHGPYETTGGIVSLLDLTTSMRAVDAQWEPTDPALPDDWAPGAHRG